MPELWVWYDYPSRNRHVPAVLQRASESSVSASELTINVGVGQHAYRESGLGLYTHIQQRDPRGVSPGVVQVFSIGEAFLGPVRL